ncbi:MAG: hypothetical protein KDC44_22770 [Phaeodactylibacter sp.]|nr:hypothetical protein [Phaeodactylibacter sp.]
MPASNAPLLLDSMILGEWESVQLHILVHSFQQQPDSSFSIQVDPGEWPDKLGLSSSTTTFYRDHKFERIDLGTDQTVKASAKGIWNLFGDTTLVFIERNATYRYELSYTLNRLLLESLLDWDGDGETDDEYLMELRKK